MQNIQKMLQQAQAMQSKFAEMQAKLEEEETEGSSGGGLVKVLITGRSQLKRVTIDPSLLVPEEKEVLEDLIVAAFNDAASKAERVFQQKMGELTAGLPLPPGFKLPF